MNYDFVKYKEQENLRAVEVSGKEEYYSDLVNIELSWTGRVDAQISNTFIQEGKQLIINAIRLFEQGYFDSAFYSLRQAIEVSTTMVYLMELESEKRESELIKWKTKSKFPLYVQMVKYLSNNGQNFKDMYHQMSDYFNELRIVKDRLNKHVHKQGFNTFYVSRNHILNKNKSDDYLLEDFTYCLKYCIGAVAVLRLAVDPFPILLMDEELYSRTGDLLTIAYSEGFISKYIGSKNIEDYKKTKIYISHYESILNEEKLSPSVLDIVKTQYIDKNKIDEIINQIHLLNKTDTLAFIVANASEKISKVYFYDGLLSYFTSTKSLRESFSFDSRDFAKIKNSVNTINNHYDEAYLSFIQFREEELFFEHNEKFTNEEINSLCELLSKHTQ